MALLAGLVLLGCAGDPQPPLLRQLERVARFNLGDLGYQGTTRYGIDGDLLYVGGQPPFATSMRAFRLTDGAAAWQARSDLIPLRRSGSVLLLESGYCVPGIDPEVVAVDGDTGVQLWRLPGRIRAAWGALALITPQPAMVGCAQPREPVFVPASPASGPPAGVTGRMVDLRSGRTTWTVGLADDVLPAIGADRAGRVVLLAMDRAGHWLRRDLLTGTVLDPAVPLPVWPAGTPRTGMTTITLLPDAVITATGNADDAIVSGHDPVRLGELWTRRVDHDPGGVPLHQVSCGTLLCLGNSVETLRLDATTGAVRWSSYTATEFVAVSSNWLVGSPSSLSGSRAVLMDATTGRTERLLTPWVPVLDRGLDHAQPTSTAVLYRRGVGRTWFGWIDPDRGVTTPRLTGYLPGDKEECVGQRQYVACRAEDGALELWRFPAGTRR